MRLSELIITSEEFKNPGYFLTVYVKLTLPASNKGRAFCSAPLFRLDEVKVGDEYAQNLEGDL